MREFAVEDRVTEGGAPVKHATAATATKDQSAALQHPKVVGDGRGGMPIKLAECLGGVRVVQALQDTETGRPEEFAEVVWAIVR